LFNACSQFQPAAVHPLFGWFVSVVSPNDAIATGTVKIYKGVFVSQFCGRFPLNRLAVLVHQIREAAGNMFPKISPLESSFCFAFRANRKPSTGNLMFDRRTSRDEAPCHPSATK
jgi:hypothetical protein